jgi:hypothetical protein
VAGKKPKFYAVSLLDRKEVAISLGKLEKGSVLLKRTARVQVCIFYKMTNKFLVFYNMNSSATSKFKKKISLIL